MRRGVSSFDRSIPSTMLMKQVWRKIWKITYSIISFIIATSVIIFLDLPITQYRPLIAAVDSPVGSPITSTIIDFKNAYRDPITFRSSTIESLTIQPIKMIQLLNDKQNNQIIGIKNIYIYRCVCWELLRRDVSSNKRLQAVKIFLRFHISQYIQLLDYLQFRKYVPFGMSYLQVVLSIRILLAKWV